MFRLQLLHTSQSWPSSTNDGKNQLGNLHLHLCLAVKSHLSPTLGSVREGLIESWDFYSHWAVTISFPLYQLIPCEELRFRLSPSSQEILSTFMLSWFQKRPTGKSGFSPPPGSNEVFMMSAATIRGVIATHSYLSQPGLYLRRYKQKPELSPHSNEIIPSQVSTEAEQRITVSTLLPFPVRTESEKKRLNRILE